ncbi:FAD-binding domain-containing protein [Byssothecium circinans]|uniref:FAD-binding domain-containing protein n=1 Tax=Byssothecium circinans TaxID=147558 RepID=A0A6A5TS26_9PLEO|nr:FAD-binding domain-containing protein [Byssothecium circinans]
MLKDTGRCRPWPASLPGTNHTKYRYTGILSMRTALIVSLSALVAGGLAQSNAEVFEPANFDVSAALLSVGVNVSAIPELAGLQQRSSLSACKIACASIQAIHGLGEVLTQGSPAFANFTGSYWSAVQGELSPYCIFKPNSVLEVSVQVLISRLTQCPFAVKGGGHAAFAGSSSIQGGITVSLEKLNQVSVSSDKKIASIGAGNRWLNVYQSLEKEGVSVVGGRVATVGVSGLTLGGGISFFSNRYGWACDNVQSYEVVTASGLIINVSATSYPDLYWALRGGGGNFGVVTKFNLNAFTQGKMWGGARLLSNDSFPAALDAYYNFATKGSIQDPDAAQIISFGYAEGFGPLASVQLDYAKPIANASVFNDFNAIPAVQSTTDIHTHAELTIMLNEGIAYGVRDTYWDVSFKVDRSLFTFLVDTFYRLLPNIVEAAGLLPVISLQAITIPQLQQMQKNGGNALGLDPSGGPYFIMNMGANWDNPADDARILKFHADVIDAVKAEARKRGLDNDFVYMNYASQFEDPIASYGRENKKRLKGVAKKYDPQQVFQKLHPGYFKLEGPPNSTWPA